MSGFWLYCLWWHGLCVMLGALGRPEIRRGSEREREGVVQMLPGMETELTSLFQTVGKDKESWIGSASLALERA